jgi:two-component system CheB/CheR fusion protein
MVMNKDFFIVGIGASAGGESILYDFFENLPRDLPAAYIVVCHLKRDYQSQMKFLLSRHTPMQVFTIRDGEDIKANCIYLIPENKNAYVKNRKFSLVDRKPDAGSNVDLDDFFIHLAETVGSCAIGIILSGIGTDGAAGAQAIEAAGGMVMVQDPKTSKYDSLPHTVIANEYPDSILPAKVMGKRLSDYMKSHANT